MSPTYDFSGSDEEAAARAEEFETNDPFPSIPRALLSSAEIEDYARVTGMLYPFCRESLNSASYEAHVGGSFIRWDDKGARAEKHVKRGDKCLLPANSIAFLQVEPEFRLPNYIALRFNLRITHVHRGLLLGTGPLVDPGFKGRLLIPLHNFTSDDCDIDTNDALIWIEFTKTTFGFKPKEEEAACLRDFRAFPAAKKQRTPEYYLHKANAGNAIRSSIPDFVRESKEIAETAQESAQEAENALKTVRAIGIGAALVGIATVGAILIGSYSLLQDSKSLTNAVLERMGQLQIDSSTASLQIERLMVNLDLQVKNTLAIVERINSLEQREVNTLTNGQSGEGAEN